MAATPTSQSMEAGWSSTGVIVDAIEVIDGMANSAMPVPLAAKFCKVIDWGRPIFAGYTMERSEIINKFGTAIGDGKFNIPQERVATFNLAINTLRGEPTAMLPAALMFNETDFGAFMLTPMQYLKIKLFIK